MFGIRNGMTQQAFCSACRLPWERCLRRCNRQAQPVNSNGRPLRLLNPQTRSAAWRYRGRPTAVFCNGCGGPYYSGCCNGAFGPINALGEVLMLDGLVGGFMGTPDLLRAAMVSELMGCGLCYGTCLCTANTASLLGEILLIDGIVDGNVAEVAMGAALSCGCFGSCSCGLGLLMTGFVAEVADEIGDAREEAEAQQAYQDGGSDTQSYDTPADQGYTSEPPVYEPPADTGSYDSFGGDIGGGGDFGGGW